jgi:hypothetical protein
MPINRTAFAALVVSALAIGCTRAPAPDSPVQPAPMDAPAPPSTNSVPSDSPATHPTDPPSSPTPAESAPPRRE